MNALQLNDDRTIRAFICALKYVNRRAGYTATQLNKKSVRLFEKQFDCIINYGFESITFTSSSDLMFFMLKWQ